MKQLNKYKILERLGGGATSDVYLAFDPFLQIHVALKVLKQELLQDSEYASRARHMFMNEARLVRELQHPCIMAILDAVQDENNSYLVLEYVDGKPLTHYINSGTPLAVEAVMQIAFKCCMAMEYASGRGLVHRDLKPANLLINQNGDLKISDFGVAQLLNAEATQLSGMVGSPSYMSPEQIAEQKVDARSDMFSLGVVLYEVLTGERPFKADNVMSLLYQITNTPHKPIRALRPDLPEMLEWLIDMALQKNPENRFPSWQVFADHLSVTDASFKTAHHESQDFSDREKFLALRQNSFFSSFHDPQIWQTLRAAKWLRLKAGDILMQEGAIGGSFSILIEGEVTISKQGRTLARLGPGASLGEMAFLKPEQPTRSATITAATPIVVVKFTRAALEHGSMELRVRFERRFLQILVERLNDTSRHLAKRLSRI